MALNIYTGFFFNLRGSENLFLHTRNAIKVRVFSGVTADVGTERVADAVRVSRVEHVVESSNLETDHSRVLHGAAVAERVGKTYSRKLAYVKRYTENIVYFKVSLFSLKVRSICRTYNWVLQNWMNITPSMSFRAQSTIITFKSS